MENKNVSSKYIGKVLISYGVIVALVNFLGYRLVSSGGMPVANNEAFSYWLQYMSEHNTLITTLSVCTFIVPTVLITIYAFRIKDDLTNGFINVPTVYSAMGTLGWILSFLLEIVFLFIAQHEYDIKLNAIMFSSLLNIIQTSIFIFTFVFLILDFLHRKVVLPKVFPEGNLSQFRVRKKPSLVFIVLIFYFSVGFYPMSFLAATLLTLTNNNGIKIPGAVYIVMGINLLFVFAILWAFCDYFNTPIMKLKQGAERVKSGNYKDRVSIVTNDAFGDLADSFNDMTQSIDEKNQKIHAIQNSIIKGMAVMVESRDNSTGGHISRTSDCVRVFVNKLVTYDEYQNLSPSFCKSVIKAAPMHDLGKIAVDDAVLRKPGKFTDEEYEKMKAHSKEGARIVETVLAQVDDEEFKQIAINVAHFHHEKWNGTGYPEKISENEIPLEARIMALADVFDALVSKRCYKDSFSYDKAFSIIEESLGSHFDPELGKIFIQCRPELEALYDGYLEET